MGINERSFNFASLDDSQLIQMIRDENELAMNELIARYIPYINKQAAFYHKNTGSFVEIDDLKQEGMIGLLFAIEGYMPDKGASFKTYAVTCIMHNMLSKLRYEKRASRVPDDQMVYLDDTGYDFLNDSENIDPQDLLISNEEVKRLYNLIDKRLTALEKKTFLYYLSGCSYAEIAKGLNTSQKAVDNALQRVRRKLRS